MPVDVMDPVLDIASEISYLELWCATASHNNSLVHIKAGFYTPKVYLPFPLLWHMLHKN